MKLKKPKFWDYPKPNLISNILFPLSKIYQIISKLRIIKKDKFEQIKCICVGNIYLGGTGKTSLSVELKKIFDEKKIKCCFVKKKYDDQADEQNLLENYGRTFVEKSRKIALKRAISENYQVAIFDDGLQDKSISYDLIFICFNQINKIGNGRLIPSGPLRENLEVLKENKNIFIIGNDENNSEFKNFLLNKFSDLNFFEGIYVPINIYNLKSNENFIIFSGIGNHKTFLEMLKKEELNIIKDFEFPDHYHYSIGDLERIKNIANKYNAKILTTKKDFLRIDVKNRKGIEYVDIHLKIIQIDLLKNKVNF